MKKFIKSLFIPLFIVVILFTLCSCGQKGKPIYKEIELTNEEYGFAIRKGDTDFT